MTLPPPLSPGEKLTGSWIRQLLDYIRQSTPVAGPGILSRRTPSGTILTASAQSRGASAAARPWTFSCTENPDSGEREGGWKNGILQLGYEFKFHNYDLGGDFGNSINYHDDITDETECEDGEYYLECDVDAGEVKIVNDTVRSGINPGWDAGNNKINIYIGTVEDGKQKCGIYQMPVCYIYV